MELTITNLKALLLNTIGQDLIENGFVFSKSSFEFRKKIGKNKVVAAFFFYDYKPSWVEYNLRFEFTIEEIRKESIKFSKYCSRQFFTDTKLVIEGQFHPDTKDKEWKYQFAYTHKIYDLKNCSQEIEISRKLLKEHFLPLIDDYTDLNRFQKKHLSSYEGAEKYTPLTSLLMAAKLKGLPELEELVAYLWEKLKIESMNEEHLDKQLFNKLIPYAMSNP